MGARVVNVDAFGVDIAEGDGATQRLDAHTTVWAAGVEASPLAAELARRTGATVIGLPQRAHRVPDFVSGILGWSVPDQR